MYFLSGSKLSFKYFVFVLILNSIFGEICGCPKTPNVIHGRRTRGDNGYKLLIGNSPTGYTPGKTYNLLLLGSRTHDRVQHFTHFTLTAEALVVGSRRPTVASPQRVGRFQLYGDSLTKFNEKCINTISEADDLAKTEVQVMWVAPQKGSGCVALSAMVYEGQRSWFSDDGELSKIICETKSSSETIKKECCACDEAKYSFIFEGIWSNETHPRDYPFAVWLTHFSDVVGASHDSNFSFWGENHIATDGFRSLAEWGSPSALESELRLKGPRLRTLIKAAGLWYPSVNTNTTSNFRTDRKHHKVSMVSMFGPSPDWVVGINGLDLCNEDCSWKDSIDIDLYPWDSGTDSGISYMSPNAETIPRERMYKITTMYPEDPRAPFYNPKSNDMTPLAKLYIRREKIISRNCDDDFLQALQLDVSDQSEEHDTRPECQVTEFSQWTPCSVTCGKGLRMKSREYKTPSNAERIGCTRQLIMKEMCVAPIAECKYTNRDDGEDEGENLALSQSTINEAGDGIGLCQTTPWSVWNECSSSCGIGITMRTRTFVNHLGRKRCPHISVVEKEKCMKPDCVFDDSEMPDAMCPTTQWSDWSPCTATCGKGVSIRTRLLLVEPDTDLLETCKGKTLLNQQKECNIQQDCGLDLEMAKVFCREQPEEGPCRGEYNRYAFNERSGRCEMFVYGGCRGNRNNFLTSRECMSTCRQVLRETENQQQIITPAINSRQFINERSSIQQPAPLGNSFDSVPEDCVMSEWTEWSACSSSCGEGISERFRFVVREPRNGGLACQKRTSKRRRCNSGSCNI